MELIVESDVRLSEVTIAEDSGWLVGPGFKDSDIWVEGPAGWEILALSPSI